MNLSDGVVILPPSPPGGMLGWWDMGVFCGMLAVSALIGVYFAVRGEGGAAEYLRGSSRMSVLPVSASLVASFISGITMLGVPSEIYRFGPQHWVIIVSVQLVCLTIGLVYVPVYRRLNLDSCYQYLELRFNYRVRKLASVLFIISMLSYIPVVIYVPALAFSQVTGIHVHVISPLTCLVCIFYTTLGGLRAVVWTDALQTVLMLAAMLAVMVLGAGELGGWGRVWEINQVGGRDVLFNLDPDPLQRNTLWTVGVGLYFQFLSECAVGQGFVQRYLSVPTLGDARKTLLGFAVGLVLIGVMSVGNGLLLYAAYHGCDPITAGRVKQPDQLLPLYVAEVTGHIPGLSGVFVAGVFSAALSSMSTGLNAMSGVLVEDLLAERLPRCLSKGAWLRVCAAGMGAVCVTLVLFVERLGGVVQSASSLSGITAGTMLGLFSMGMFCRRANSVGALAGSVTSLVLVGALVLATQAAIASGALKAKTLPLSTANCTESVLTPLISTQQEEESEVWPVLRLSYMYYSLLGAIIVLLVGLPASVLLPSAEPPPDPALLFWGAQHPARQIKPIVINSRIKKAP